ncbi:MAG: alpha/beta fold hydrolase [Phenylobacterium sp.]|nr:MAG: alpha/beta fold hydrolase [Phenylobacterium sp.]
MLAACAALSLTAAGAAAAPLPPAAIFTDPPHDAAHPARMDVLHIPSGGGELNAIALVPAGAAPHPTVVLFHGLPGNEKNLDLAQAMRRAGWTVVAPNYRGSWGSPGHYSFKGNLEDARAVLAYVRGPQGAKLGVDPRRLVIMGHSMGGWVTAVTGGRDEGVAGAALISAADMSTTARAPEKVRLDLARDNHESLAATPEDMAAELATLTPGEGFAAAAPGLAKHPLLVITSDDGLQANADKLVMDVKTRGGRVAVVHIATDHSYDDARIRLESEVLAWLAKLPK